MGVEEADQDAPEDRRPATIAAVRRALLVSVDDLLQHPRSDRDRVVPLEPALAHVADWVPALVFAVEVGLVTHAAAPIRVRQRLYRSVGAPEAELRASAGQVRAPAAGPESRRLRQ